MKLFTKQVRLFNRVNTINQHCKTMDIEKLTLFRDIQYPEQLDSMRVENIYQDLQHKDNEFNGRAVELMLDLHFQKMKEFQECDWMKKWQNQMVDKIVSVKRYNHNKNMVNSWGMDLEILMKIGLWADIFCVRDERLWEFIAGWTQKVFRILDDTNTDYFVVLLESISHQQQADQQFQDHLVEFIEKNYQQINSRQQSLRVLKCMYLLKMGRLEFVQKMISDLDSEQMNEEQTKLIQIMIDEMVDDQMTQQLQKQWGIYQEEEQQQNQQYMDIGVGKWTINMYWNAKYNDHQEYKSQLYGYLLNNVDRMRLKEVLDVVEVMVDIQQKHGQYRVSDKVRHAIQGWIINNKDQFRLVDSERRQQIYMQIHKLGIMTDYLEYTVENNIIPSFD